MMKKRLINCFLVVWLPVFAIDAAPELGDWHRKVKNNLDPYLDVTGLWQGGWKLFAPIPDHINVAITANLTFSDGREVVWRSPDWRSMSAWQRFVNFRGSEFIDGVRRDKYRDAWPTFADYLGRTVTHPADPNIKPTQIALTREWVNIPPPSSINLAQFPEVPAMNNSFVFFEKDLQP